MCIHMLYLFLVVSVSIKAPLEIYIPELSCLSPAILPRTSRIDHFARVALLYALTEPYLLSGDQLSACNV